MGVPGVSFDPSLPARSHLAPVSSGFPFPREFWRESIQTASLGARTGEFKVGGRLMSCHVGSSAAERVASWNKQRGTEKVM